MSPALLPIMGFFYSFLNSWHCSLMCGPSLLTMKKSDAHRLLIFRQISYAIMGGIFGGIGSSLKKSLEFEVVQIFGFVIYIFIILAFILPTLLPDWVWLKKLSPQKWLGKVIYFPRARGLLMGLIPCHILGFFYGLSALVGNIWIGMFLLFGHGIVSMPGLVWPQSRIKNLLNHKKSGVFLIRWALVFLVIFQILFFLGNLLYSPEEVHNRILFCI